MKTEMTILLTALVIGCSQPVKVEKPIEFTTTPEQASMLAKETQAEKGNVR